jgi:hypothetical protein
VKGFEPSVTRRARQKAGASVDSAAGQSGKTVGTPILNADTLVLADFPAVAFERIDIAANFRRRDAAVEIVLIESGDLLQPLDIEQSEPMTRQTDEVVPPEPRQDAVEVDGGQAERVGEFDLRQRQLDRVILGQPNRPSAAKPARITDRRRGRECFRRPSATMPLAVNRFLL